MAIGGNFNNIFENYNNNVLGNHDNKYLNNAARGLEKVDSAILSLTPPSERSDIMWKRNLLAQVLGQNEIYPSADVYKAQFAPYLK